MCSSISRDGKVQLTKLRKREKKCISFVQKKHKIRQPLVEVGDIRCGNEIAVASGSLGVSSLEANYASNRVDPNRAAGASLIPRPKMSMFWERAPWTHMR